MSAIGHKAMRTCLHRARDWIFQGAQHAHDFHMQRKIVQVNVGAILTFFTIVLLSLVSVWTGNEGLITLGLMEIPMSCILVALVFWQHRSGQIETARLILWIGVTVVISTAILNGQGTLIFTHGYYLVLAVIAAIFSPIYRWRRLLLVVSINIGLFVFFQIHGWPASAQVQRMNKDDIRLLETIMIASCAAVVIVLMLIGEYAATRNEIELQIMANTDPLTRLPNRRAFRTRLKRNLDTARKRGGSIAIAMIDIDYFKRINDEHGHDMGDTVLQMVSRLLLQHVRSEDTLARFGGKEFSLLLPQTTPEQALIATERMRKAVEQTLFGDSQAPLRLTISVGLACIQPGARADQAIRAADRALYHAKQGGRNRVLISPETVEPA